MWSKYPSHKHYIYNTVERRITKLDEKFEYTNKHTIRRPGVLQSIQKKRARVMVFNATFNNIVVIFWLSVLLVDDTEYSEKTTDLSLTSFFTKCLSSTPRHERDSNSRTVLDYVINCGYISLKYEICLQMLFDYESCKFRVKYSGHISRAKAKNG